MIPPLGPPRTVPVRLCHPSVPMRSTEPWRGGASPARCSAGRAGRRRTCEDARGELRRSRATLHIRPRTTPSCCCRFGGPERPDDVLPFLRERHPGPGHPARAAGSGRRALPPLRRPQPDQRPEPRAARARCGPSSPPAASTCRCCGATATGRRTSPTPCARPRDGGRRRVRGRTTARTPVLGLPAVPRGPRRRAARAGRRGVAGLAVDKVRHYFNHPGFVDADHATPSRALDALPEPLPGRRPAGLRHALDPRRDGRRRRPRRRRARTSRQHRDVAARWPPTWSAAASAATRPGTSSTARGPGRRASPGSSPTSTTTCGTLHARGVPGRRRRPDRVRLRPHGGRATTSTPRRARPPASSACRSPGRPRSAPTRAFVAGLVDLVLERAGRGARRGARAAGRRRSRPVAGRSARRAAAANLRAERPAACGADWTGAPLRRRASPVTGGLPTSQRARRARRAGGPGRRRAGPRRAARPTSAWPRPSPARRTSSRRWTGVASELLRELLARRAPRRRPARRGGRPASTGTQRGHLGRGPDRRHRQLPLRHPGVRGQRRGRDRRPDVPGGLGGRWPAACTTPCR